MGGVILFFIFAAIGAFILIGGYRSKTKAEVITWGVFGGIFLAVECVIIYFAAQMAGAFVGEATGLGLLLCMVIFSLVALSIYFTSALSRFENKKDDS